MRKGFLKFLKLLSLSFISCATAVLVCELAVRIFLPQDKMITWIQMHPDGFVMNQSGGTSFQEFGSRKAEYHFNSHRLRGIEIEPHKVNVLSVGDSFTFGLLLDEEDTYVRQLQNKANKLYPDSLQFLNGGIGGSGMADWPGWLDEFGSELEIDYLIYFMNYDDMNRALSKNLFIFEPSAPDSLIKSQRWKPRVLVPFLEKRKSYGWLQANSEIGNILVKLMWKHLYFKDLTKNFDPEKSSVQIPELDSFSEDSDYTLHLGNAILNKMDKWCFQNGCELLVFTTGFFETETMSVYDQRFYENYRTTMAENNDNFFDNKACVEKHFVSDLEELKIPGDTHPNELGARVIADCTWEKLIVKFEANQTLIKP